MRILKNIDPAEATENSNRILQGSFDDEGYLYNGILFADSGAIDAFGRLRVSNPSTIFDSKQIFKDPDLSNDVENFPLFFDNQEVSGTGSATSFNINTASTTLSVSNVTAGNRVRQTKMRFNYQPGKSILFMCTFHFSSAPVAGITRRQGYFDDNNGIFFEDNGEDYAFVIRSNVSGSPDDMRISQSHWNLDKFDGTGHSNALLDATKTQIMVLDFEWLGAGRVRVGFVINGYIRYAHQFLHSNNLSNSVYMSLPNLPVRTQIINDGTGEASSATTICSTVMAEGGTEDLGVIRYASTEGSAVIASTENTLYAVLGIRLKSNYIGTTINLLSAAIQIQSASHQIEWVLKLNPTVAGTFNYADKLQSAIQVAKGATANTVTGGYDITGGFAESGGAQAGNSGSEDRGIHNAIRLGSLIDGTRDTMVLCIRPIGGSTAVEVEGSMVWREIL